MQSPQASDLLVERKAKKPSPTKSSKLMAATAAQRLANPKSQQLGFPSLNEMDQKLWKMSKFSKIGPKVQMG